MSKPPLWEVLRRAYDVSPPLPVDADLDCIDRHGYAAEIRALRDWLVPEEEGPLLGSKPDVGITVDHAMWKQREYFRALLTAEAERAECGD